MIETNQKWTHHIRNRMTFGLDSLISIHLNLNERMAHIGSNSLYFMKITLGTFATFLPTFYYRKYCITDFASDLWLSVVIGGIIWSILTVVLAIKWEMWEKRFFSRRRRSTIIICSVYSSGVLLENCSDPTWDINVNDWIS
jgi:hypothetical protein